MVEYMCENLEANKGWTINSYHDNDNTVKAEKEEHRLVTSMIICRVVTDKSQLVNLVTL